MTSRTLRPRSVFHRGAWLALPLVLGACSSGNATPTAPPGEEVATPKNPSYELVDAEVLDKSSVAGLVQTVSPSVVSVVVTKQAAAMPMSMPHIPGFPGFPGMPEPGRPVPEQRGSGSGFIIDGGYVVTNDHVVKGVTSVKVRLQDDRELDAEVVGRDPRLDLALLRIEDEDAATIPAVRLGDSDALLVGEHVVAVGNPFGLGHTVTLGIVSAKARTIGAGPYDDFIQTDASINPGNSGGPLFNLKGEVVGINTAIRRGADGIGFAIPIDDLEDVLPQLRDKGFVERGKLGLGFQPVDTAVADAFGLDRPIGALVNHVEAGSPADEAGIRAGDLIVGVDGESVHRAAHLPKLVAQNAPGESIDIELRARDGSTRTVTAVLDRLEDAPEPADIAPRDDSATTLLGIQVQPVAGGLRVVGLQRALGDLRVGDGIVEVDGQPVSTVDEIREATKPSDREAHLFKVRRGDRTLFVGVPR